VFSPKTGLLYEQRLILKALETSGECPVTNEKLDQEQDLCKVKSSSVSLPRPPTGDSFPSMLNHLQNEWDSLLLEQVSLRKELVETRKDLATALYEREAAGAVIARLLKENEGLKNQLEEFNGDHAANKDDMELENNGQGTQGTLPQAISERVVKCNDELVAARGPWQKKLKSNPVELKETDWKANRTLKPHKTNKPGVSCIAVESFDIRKESSTSKWVVSGGADCDVKVIDGKLGQVAATLSKHKGKVTDVCLSGNMIASASEDKSMILWGHGENGAWKDSHVIREHTKSVTSCPIHPTRELVGTTGLDGLWCLTDISSGDIVLRHSVESSKFSCGRFHPDGKLFGMGDKSGTVSIFSILDDPTKGNATTLDHGSRVNSLSFSENGYLCASAGDDGAVKIWDLRTLAVFSTISCENKGAKATCVSFDQTGGYIAMGDSAGGIQILRKPKKKKVPEWTSVVSLFEHKKAIASLAFSGSSLWASSLDRSVVEYCAV